MPPDNQLVNVPAAEFERIAAAPMTLARLDADDLLRRGNVAGASARLEAGLAESAAIRAQAMGGQPAPVAPAAVQPVAPTPAVAPPLASPGSPFPFPVPPALAAMRPPNSGPAGTTAEDIASSRFDLGRPMGLRRLR